MFFLYLCSVYNSSTLSLLRSKVKEKLTNKEYIKINTDISYSFFYLKFSKDSVTVSKCNQDNITEEVAVIKFDLNVKNLIRKILIREKVHYYCKVLVFDQKDYILYKRARQVIDSLVKESFSLPKESRYCRWYVEKDCYLYRILKSSPIESNDKLVELKNVIEYTRIEGARLYNIGYFTYTRCKFLCIELKKIDPSEFGLPYKLNERKGPDCLLSNLYLLMLFNIVNLLDLPPTAAHFINTENKNKIEVLNNEFCESKNEKFGFALLLGENEITFKYPEHSFKYSVGKEKKKFVISHECFEKCTVFFEEIRSFKRNNLTQENLFFRLLENHLLVQSRLKKLLLQKECGRNFVFMHSCFALDLITEEELNMFTGQVFDDKYLQDIDLEKYIIDNEIGINIYNVMANVQNGITYIMNLCLFEDFTEEVATKDNFDIEILKIMKKTGIFIEIEKNRDIFEELGINGFKILGGNQTDVYEEIEKARNFNIKAFPIIENSLKEIIKKIKEDKHD